MRHCPVKYHFILFAAIFCWGLLLPQSATAEIPLTPREQAFLEEHPVIRFGADAEWEPYVIRRADGSVTGVDADILEFIRRETGADIHLETGPWSEIVERAKSGELDGLSTSAANPDRKPYFLFSKPYVRVFPAFVVSTESPGTFDRIEDFNGGVVAVLKGNSFYHNLLAAYPEITLLDTDSDTESIAMVAEGKVDGAVVASTRISRHKKAFPGLVKLGYVATDHPMDVLFSVRKEWPELVSIIDKGLAAMPVKDFNTIYRRWFGEAPPGSALSSGLRFTSEERAWLADGHKVRVYIDKSYPPYYRTSSEGVEGMSIDYLDAISKAAGFQVEYVTAMSWPEALAEMHDNRRIDMLASAYITEDRQQFMRFTEEYLRSPSVILTRTDSPFVGAITDLLGKTVVVERDYATQRWLRTQFPRLRLVMRETTTAALRALSVGQADAYVGNLTVATYIARSEGLENIKVAAPSPFVQDNQAMAVRRDWPELVSIINKTLAAMPVRQKEEIRQRWMPPMRYEFGINKEEIWEKSAEGAVLVLVVLGVMLFWNRRLQREILNRKSIEERLARSEVRYRRLFELSADAILILVDRVFVDCNEAALKMLGYNSRSDFLSATPSQLSPEYQPDGASSEVKAQKMMDNAVRHGSYRFEWQHTRANGQIFPVEVMLTSIPDPAHEVIHVVWRDISLRKEVERVQEELTIDLANKNFELERFCYTVSHDLKGPLVTIGGFAGLLERELGGSKVPMVREAVGHINNAADKMSVLLNDLLELSRVGRVVNPSETFSMTEVAEEALALLRGMTDGRDIVVKITDELPYVFGDRLRLREVMQNLIENALKYGGEETISIEIGCRAEDGEKACYVKDSGPGIAAEYHEKIFRVFERLERNGNGSGVGLSLVKRIIELHGGRIWVESDGTPGSGATFFFVLPWTDPPNVTCPDEPCA
jgi:PAS domain S-box-containing protein